jgi:hypothetical protein
MTLYFTSNLTLILVWNYRIQAGTPSTGESCALLILFRTSFWILSTERNMHLRFKVCLFFIFVSEIYDIIELVHRVWKHQGFLQIISVMELCRTTLEIVSHYIIINEMVNVSRIYWWRIKCLVITQYICRLWSRPSKLPSPKFKKLKQLETITMLSANEEELLPIAREVSSST